MWVPDI